jgi:antitoxin PrlF
MRSTTTIRNKGQVTIPADIRRATHLEDGDPVEVVVVEGGILLRPQKVIDATQAWFWTAAWQVGEREASEERDADAGTVYASSDEFLASLDE